MENLTRRTLLKGAPVAAVALAVPASATVATDRATWSAALSAYQRVQAEDEAFTPGWWADWQKCKEECDRIPHVALRPDRYTGHYEPVSTADRFYVAHARRDVTALDTGKMRYDPGTPGADDHVQLQREIVAAADERDRQIQVVRDRYNMDALDDRAEELGDLLADAQSHLMETRAPDLAALRWKLDHITEEAREEKGGLPAYGTEYVKQLLEDIERLMPSAA